MSLQQTKSETLPTRQAELLDLLREVYLEHMHFGWGYEGLHDRIIEVLSAEGLLPELEPIDASHLSQLASGRSKSFWEARNFYMKKAEEQR